MSKSLEALEILRECANGEKKLLFTDSLDLANTIKRDLKRKEELEKENKNLKEKYKRRAKTSHELCEALKNYEKAIEILKEHLGIKVFEFMDNEYEFSLETYYDYRLNKREYELLKEVLEGEK